MIIAFTIALTALVLSIVALNKIKHINIPFGAYYNKTKEDNVVNRVTALEDKLEVLDYELQELKKNNR